MQINLPENEAKINTPHSITIKKTWGTFLKPERI